MSLRPQPPLAIPEETHRVAHAAFPKGTLCLRIADDLGDLYRDNQFTELFPPAVNRRPHRLGWLGSPSSNTLRASRTAKPPMPSAAASTGSTPWPWN